MVYGSPCLFTRHFSSCCWLSWVLFENKTFLNGQWVGLLSTDLCEPLAAKTESKQPPSGIGGIFCLAAFSLQFCKRLSMGVLLYCCWRLHIRGFQAPQTFSAEGAGTKHKGKHPKNMRPNVINLWNEKWRKIRRKYWSLKSIFATKSFHILQLTLLCWNPYLKHWAALLYLLLARGGARTEKRERACFYCPFRLNISHHTLNARVSFRRIGIYLSAGIIFSPVGFLLNGRFLILYICAAGSVLVLSNMNSHCKHLSRQWTMAKSRDDDFCWLCRKTETECARLPIDGLKK